MKNNILKMFGIFLFVGFSLHIFILNLDIVNLDFAGVDNAVYAFYLGLWRSMESFDVIWIILAIFLFDFFYNTYFISGIWKINRLIVICMSVIISIFILIFTSLYMYRDLRILFDSFVQVYKCLMVGFGYYFIIYAILKRLFFSKNINN